MIDWIEIGREIERLQAEWKPKSYYVGRLTVPHADPYYFSDTRAERALMQMGAELSTPIAPYGAGLSFDPYLPMTDVNGVYLPAHGAFVRPQNNFYPRSASNNAEQNFIWVGVHELGHASMRVTGRPTRPSSWEELVAEAAAYKVMSVLMPQSSPLRALVHMARNADPVPIWERPSAFAHADKAANWMMSAVERSLKKEELIR